MSAKAKILPLALLVSMALPFSQSHAVSIIDEMCGSPEHNFLNWQGDFDSYCTYYYNDLQAFGKKGDKYALYDIATKKQVTPFIYDDINHAKYEPTTPFIVKRDGKIGALDSQGHELFLSDQYQDIANFSDGFASVTVKNSPNPKKFGVIDLTGKLVIPPIFDKIHPFSNGLAVVEKNKKFGVINRQGQLIVDYQYDYIGYFGKNGLTKAYIKTADPATNKYALLNTQGKLLSKPIYDDITPTNQNVTIVYQDDKWGLVDGTGNQVAPIRYQVKSPTGEDSTDFSDGLLRAFDSKTQKFGYFNGDGNIQIPFDYDYLGWNQFRRADKTLIDVKQIVNGKEKQGYIDENNRVIVPIIYDFLAGIAEDRIAVGIGDKIGFVDTQGKLVIPIVYTPVGEYYFKDGKILVQKDGKQFYIDTLGKRLP